MTTREINQKYPIKNNRWTFSEISGRWSAEDSELQHSGFLDPWNRSFPPAKGIEIRSQDEDNEVQMWLYKTTVSGTEVECIVFND